MTPGKTSVFVSCLLLFLGVPSFVNADAVSDLQNQIDSRNRQVSALEAEIAQYQRQLDTIGAKKNTLQSTINGLAISQKQLGVQIQVTQSKIASANLEIQQLSLSIGDKESSIAANQAAIASALRTMSQNETLPLVAGILSTRSLSDAWQTVDEAAQFNKSVQNHIDDLRTARTELANNRDQVAAHKAQLVSLQNDLAQQKRSVDASKAAQQQLLAQTKNQESSYQQLIAAKQASEKAFEQELIDLQNQLNLIVHPGSLPKVGSGVLSWPFSIAFMNKCQTRQNVFGNQFCITQYFGTTPFSTANPQVYSGHGHDGIDMSAAIGTPVLAALSGTVLGTGNTDLARGCYSFGKWVMVRHSDGLSTMYAHLSEIDVSTGQSVSTGQTLGLSGMTGYATGPHIHFGVYATEGTKIMTLKQFRGSTTKCANATMPVATLDAYLNPLSYL